VVKEGKVEIVNGASSFTANATATATMLQQSFLNFFKTPKAVIYIFIRTSFASLSARPSKSLIRSSRSFTSTSIYIDEKTTIFMTGHACSESDGIATQFIFESHGSYDFS